MFAATLSRRTRLAALATGFSLLLAGGAVLAQPGPAGGPGPHAGMGPGGGEPLAGILQHYKAELALNTSQQQMFDAAAALTQQARTTGRGYMQQVHAAMQAELAKPEPDLAAAAAVADDAQAKGQALRKQVRDAWLALYATFSPTQKAVVRDALASRMQKMEQRRQGFGHGFGHG